MQGINTVMYYGGHILELCGFGRGNSVKLAAVLALAQGLGLCVSTPLFDRKGRRALVLPSAVASGACIFVVAFAFAFVSPEGHSRGSAALGKALALLGLLGYLFAFGCGLSPGPWVINAEIYPLHVRGLGNSAATTTNWVANYAVSATFLTLIRGFGKSGTFALFGAVCLVSAMWLDRRLPETSGLSLEAIEDLFRRPGDKDSAAVSNQRGGGGDGGAGGVAAESPRDQHAHLNDQRSPLVSAAVPPSG